MNRLVRSIIILLFPITAFSQKEYFIYLQSETEQPFFVRMADQTHNSSPSGYVILAKLKDTTHTFKVGFPQNKWPDQQFTVVTGSRDHGYLLKNFGDKGWGLFDLQTMSVQMSTGGTAMKNAANNGITQVSVFTEILSKAANDPSLREKPVFAVAQAPQIQSANSKQEPVAIKEQVKEIKPAKAIDTPATKAESIAREEMKKEDPVSATLNIVDSKETDAVKAIAPIADTTLKKQELIARQEVKKDVNQNNVNQTPDSFQLKANTGNTPVAKQDPPVIVPEKETNPVIGLKPKDTNQAQPASTINTLNEPAKMQEVVVKEEASKETTAIVDRSEPVSNLKTTGSVSPDYERSEVIKKSESSTTEGFGLTFIDKIADYKQDTIQIVIPNSTSILENAMKSKVDDKKFLDITDEDGKTTVKKDPSKNGCLSLASENDFFKLRKKMAGEKESESMIIEAKKEFKSKCFTVDQIRNLGNLFLNEAGKFQFYEAAYPSSSDKPGFAVLQAELRDPYFIHRFKSLVD